MRRAQSVQALTLQHSVDVQKLLDSPKKELLPLLRALPEWGAAAPHQVVVSQISGALTNLIYRCHHLPSGQYVLARIFGSSGALFDRAEEQQIFAAVAHAGLGPKLLASFENGRIEEFLLDQSITASQMRTTPVSTCVAAALAMFNFTHLALLREAPAAGGAICWERTRSWVRAAQGLYSPEELAAEGLADVMAEIDALEQHLAAAGPTWVGFCHNDTQYGNMLLHTAATAGSDDLLQARASLSLDGQPGGGGDGGGGGGGVLMGSSPPSFSALAARGGGGGGGFSVVSGASKDPALSEEGSAWAYERPDDLEVSQGASPRKHPRGLTAFQPPPDAEPAAAAAGADAEEVEPTTAADPRLSVRLIDYEYAGTNPVALDIANHWCEWAADYHAPVPHRLDYGRFPSEEQQLHFARAYVAAAVALKQQKEELGLPTRADSLTRSLTTAAAAGTLRRCAGASEGLQALAEQLRRAALAYVPVSHMQWGVWGLLQARLSRVPSFDFAAYGRQRLAEWRRLRPDCAAA